MSYFVLWLGLALLVGVVGKDRKIGFGLAFLWAILLSPLIGLVIALLSDKKQEEIPYIPTSSSSGNQKVDYKQDFNLKRNESISGSTKSKMTIGEWKEKNPHKSLNDYYREIGV